MRAQCAKKVVSDSLGVVDFLFGLKDLLFAYGLKKIFYYYCFSLILN